MARDIRVLVVENSATTRASLGRNLKRWGYRPIIATGKRKQLYDNALQLAREEQCHIAIIDKRLFDDRNRHDRSGLDLAFEILQTPTRTIMLTGFEDHEHTRQAFIDLNVVDVLRKSDELGMLQNALAKAAITGWPDIEISPPGIADTIAVHLSRADEPVRVSEVQDLINCLFGRAESPLYSSVVSLVDTSNSVKTPSFGTGLRSRSAVLKVHLEGRPNSFIFKLAMHGRALREKQNFDKFVFGHLGGDRHPSLVDSLSLWDLGCTVYSFLGTDGDLSTFRTHYLSSEQDIESILTPIEAFFTTLWFPHYNARTALTQTRTLFDVYDTLWSYAPRDPTVEEEDQIAYRKSHGVLTQALRAFQLEHPDEMPTTLEVECPGTFVHPLAWLVRRYEQSLFPQLLQCVVHGDLHADNFFVDKSGMPWPIDFERTGPSHVLADFVQLENDILTHLLPDDGKESLPLEDFLRLTVALVSPKVPGEELKPPASNQHHPAARKAFDVIQGLRRTAEKLTLVREYSEYYWGLLFNAIFVLFKLDEETPQAQTRRMYAMILASVICTRLREWGKPATQPWYPDDWPIMPNSLMTDAPEAEDSHPGRSGEAVVPVNQPLPTPQDLARLQAELSKRIEWAHATVNQRRQILRAMQLPDDFPNYLDLSGNEHDNRAVIQLSARRGELVGWPGVTHLGAIAKWLLDDPADLEQSLFLQALIERYGLIRDPATRAALHDRFGEVAAELEAIQDVRAEFLDVAFLATLYGRSSAVCRIEENNAPLGTGFLIGPQLVLTNHHVVPSDDVEQKVVARFHFRRRPDGSLDADQRTTARAVLARSDATQLDFALLELSEPLATIEPLAPQLEAPGHDEAVYIIQHPQGEPQKIVLQGNFVKSVTAPRLRYGANTLPGSSGSPIFDRQGRLIGIHRGGSAHGNEGILMAAIMPHIQTHL